MGNFSSCTALSLILSSCMAEISYGTIEPLHQVIIENNSAIITCYSRTSPTWNKDGVLLEQLPLESSTTLYGTSVLINHATNSHSGEYVCHGFDEANEIFSATSELYVAGNFD